MPMIQQSYNPEWEPSLWQKTALWATRVAFVAGAGLIGLGAYETVTSPDDTATSLVTVLGGTALSAIGAAANQDIPR